MSRPVTIYYSSNGSILSEYAAINQIINQSIAALGIDRAQAISAAIELARLDSRDPHSTFVQCLQSRLEELKKGVA